MGKQMCLTSVIPLTLLLCITLGLTRVKGQGYGAGDDNVAVQQQPGRGPDYSVSSLPQYESSSGTNDENYWWLKENPFQKPSNHPGIEKTDQKPADTPTDYSATSKPKEAIGSKPQKSSNSKEFKYRPITTPYNTPQNEYEDNPCMLRRKSDCHAGGATPNALNNNPTGNQQQQSYSAETGPNYSNVQETNNKESSPQYEPKPITQHSASPPARPTNTYSNNQISNYGSTGYSQYNQQQQYNQQTHQQPSRPYQGQAQQTGGQGFETNNNYEEQPPFPGCPAAMLCVPDDWCNATGYSEGKPLSLTPAARAFRVAVSACTNVETNEVGICCRDPDYVDPWPNQGGEGGGHHHEHHKEHKPSPGQQQFQPQVPQTQTSYSASSQSYRPQQQSQAPYQPPHQQKPAYQAPPPSYAPQPQKPQHPQTSYQQSYSQPSKPAYQQIPQAAAPYTGQQVQSQQPQQNAYSATQTYQQQPIYTGQSLQQPSNPQQIAYGGAAASSSIPQQQQAAGAGYSGAGCKAT